MSSQDGNCQKFAASGRSHARDPMGAARATAPEAAATFPRGPPLLDRLWRVTTAKRKSSGSALSGRNESFMMTLMAAQVFCIPRKCSLCHICAVAVGS